MYTLPVNSPMTASSGLPFSPVMQQQAMVTLLLIENSQAMSFIWDDLRDRYLPSVVTKLGSADPTVSVSSHDGSNPLRVLSSYHQQNKMLVLESLPQQNRGFSPVPRQYDALETGLCDVRFNYDPCNRLTVGKIWNGVDVSGKYSTKGNHPNLHMKFVSF
jgi:hypothetical protein